jgi:hypothetical protein
MADEESPTKDYQESEQMEGEDPEEQGYDQEKNQIIGNLPDSNLAYIQ